MRRRGETLDRATLLASVWPRECDSNVVDVYIRYLRQKIDRPFAASAIETVRGAGYRLRTDGGAGRR